MYKLQMLKSNRNDCKNDKKTNLLGEGARSAVQKSQITVDTQNSQQTTKFVSYIRVT